VWVLGNSTGGRRFDEDSPTNPLPLVSWRPAHEQMVLRSGKNAVLRPGIVYGGRQSICAAWFAAADQKQPIEIVGDGRNRWPWVDVEELAQLYARAVEQKAAGILHGIDDTDTTVREAAESLGSVTSKNMDGPFADALKSNQIVSSEKTRRKLGWNPRKTFTSTLDEQWRDWRKRLTSS
jgi:nucleoside-diphosphate-sugar epimerase